MALLTGVFAGSRIRMTRLEALGRNLDRVPMWQWRALRNSGGDASGALARP